MGKRPSSPHPCLPHSRNTCENITAVIFIEVANIMAGKCMINGGTVPLMLVCLGQIF